MKAPKAKILVVDDEPSQRKMLKANLTLEGYEIHEADDGTTAIAGFRRNSLTLSLWITACRRWTVLKRSPR